MTEIEQRARDTIRSTLAAYVRACKKRLADPAFSDLEYVLAPAMLTFAREREAEAIEKAAMVAEAYLHRTHGSNIATAIRELNTPSERVEG